jgi:hypothetical protein
MGGCFERLFGECFASSAMRQMVSMSVVVRCCSLMPCYPLRAGFFRSTLFWPLAAGRWPLAAGRWPLAAGRWPLAAGRWPLAAGRWPLAVAGCPMKHFWIVPFQEKHD